jgi:diguanylate cyclase (GGDEF)-like protein
MNSAAQQRTVALALQGQLDLIGDALDASEDGFAIWRAIRQSDATIGEFSLLLMNKAGAEAAGQPQAMLIGQTLTEVVGADTAKGLHALFEKALNQGHGAKEVVPVVSADGQSGSFENTVVPFGRDLVFATYRDVSDEQREHNRLVWLSEHDFLTGMPNRAKLQDALARATAFAITNATLMAFVFIDIDHFKNVNDTHGHDIGDALLVNFVKRIRHSLPESALVARIAGDEFAVLLTDLKGESHLKDLMNEVFSAMKRPFSRDEIEMAITCSAGCVLTDGSEHPDEIMRIADKLMYEAKFQGRNRFGVESVLKII